jgi:hypothetical protein
MVITNIYITVSNNFWGVLFTRKLGFPSSQISTYVAVRSIVMTLCFFVIGPRLTNMRRFRLPLWAGFAAFLVSQLLLVVMPPRTWILLVVVLEAIASALVSIFAPLVARSPIKGAKTSVYLASSPSVEGIMGKYFDSQVIPAAPQATDMVVARKLWDISSELVHLADGP